MLRVGKERGFEKTLFKDEKTSILKVLSFLSYPGERPLEIKDLKSYEDGYELLVPMGNRLKTYAIRESNSFRVYERRSDGLGYNINNFSVVGEDKNLIRVAFLGSNFGISEEQFSEGMKRR